MEASAYSVGHCRPARKHVPGALIADCASIGCSQRINAGKKCTHRFTETCPEEREIRTSKSAPSGSASSLVCRCDCHDAAFHIGHALCLSSQSEWLDVDGLPRLHRAVERGRQLRKGLVVLTVLNALQRRRLNGHVRAVPPLRLRDLDLPIRRLPLPGELLRLNKGLIRATLPSGLLPGVSSRLLPRIPCWLLTRISSRLLPRISSRLLPWVARLLPGVTRLLPGITRLLPGITRLRLCRRRRLWLGSHIVCVVVIRPTRNQEGRYPHHPVLLDRSGRRHWDRRRDLPRRHKGHLRRRGRRNCRRRSRRASRLCCLVCSAFCAESRIPFQLSSTTVAECHSVFLSSHRFRLSAVKIRPGAARAPAGLCGYTATRLAPSPRVASTWVSVACNCAFFTSLTWFRPC
jgi:hypothetical protein